MYKLELTKEELLRLIEDEQFLIEPEENDESSDVPKRIVRKALKVLKENKS